MNENMQHVEELIASEKFAEAIDALTELLKSDSENDELYYIRGKILWRLGRHGAATSDYTKASLINPASPATKALEMANDVADFFNPDLYNP